MSLLMIGVRSASLGFPGMRQDRSCLFDEVFDLSIFADLEIAQLEQKFGCSAKMFRDALAS